MDTSHLPRAAPRQVRRLGGGDLAPWLVLGPNHSYPSTETFTVRIAGLVDRQVDQLAPTDPARDFVSLGAATRPLFVAAGGGVVAGKPCMRSDNVDDCMVGPSLGFLSSPCTIYTCGAALVAPVGNSQIIGDAGTQRLRATVTNVQLQGGALLLNIAAVGVYAAVPWWFEWHYSGATVTVTDNFGNVATGGEVPQAPFACGLFATSGGSQRAGFEHYWTFTYPRALAASERVVARAAASAYLGI